jgi:endonuclease-3
LGGILKETERKIGLILRRLKKKYPEEMVTTIRHKSAWELLVGTVLSAQTTDAQVNKITPGMFREYPNIRSYLELKPFDLYKYTKHVNIYRNKSKYIINAAHFIHENYSDRVPDSLEKLVEIPGVGRKTANVVLSNAFGKNRGIAIDTHCITVANRLLQYKTKNAKKIEQRLMEIVPESDWRNISLLFIALGRDVCTARIKYCQRCVLKDICPSSDAK